MIQQLGYTHVKNNMFVLFSIYYSSLAVGTVYAGYTVANVTFNWKQRIL